MVKLEELSLDQILQNVVLYLVQQDHNEIAQLLVECELDSIGEADYIEIHGGDRYHNHHTLATLSAPHALVTAIGSSDPQAWFEFREQGMDYEGEYPTQFQIQKAFEAVTRQSPVLVDTYVQLAVIDDADWRNHLREVAKGERKTNQGRQFGPQDKKSGLIVWKNLHFRSPAEVKIAEALERREVLYFPNCAARLGTSEHRHTKEPDFVICHNGKWGILQVDGRQYHQQAAAADHQIDRQFQRHGATFIQRYPGRDCMNDPDAVVREFLDLLAQQSG